VPALAAGLSSSGRCSSASPGWCTCCLCSSSDTSSTPRGLLTSPPATARLPVGPLSSQSDWSCGTGHCCRLTAVAGAKYTSYAVSSLLLALTKTCCIFRFRFLCSKGPTSAAGFALAVDFC